MNVNTLDCVIVGAGTAGLAAAMVLSRARRTVALIDAGEQNNRRAVHTGGVFLHDGTSPADLYEKGLRQLSEYPTFSSRHDRVVSAVPDDGGFVVGTESGGTARARKLLLAQGVKFEKSPVPGVDELWGSKVFHCPYCDGYESRDMRVLAAGGRGWLTHQKTMMPNWIDDITWADIDELASVEDDGDLKVTFSDGSVASYERLFVEQIQVLRDGLADALGCERADAGFVSVGPLGETSVPGVYSAGDQSQKAQQVNLAVGAGHQAGMGVLIALSAEDRAHRPRDDGGA